MSATALFRNWLRPPRNAKWIAARGRGLRWDEQLTDVGVELRVVEIVDQVLDGLDGPVPGVRLMSAPPAATVWPVSKLLATGKAGCEGKIRRTS